MATPKDVRIDNTASILRVLMGGGSYSKAEIARRTGMSKTLVGTIVNCLLDSEIAEWDTSSVRPQVQGGRPGQLIRMSESAGYVLGVDLYPDHIDQVVLDLNGNAVEATQISGLGLVGGELLEHLLHSLESSLQRMKHRVFAIGVASPGIVDMTSGSVESALELNWRNVHVVEAICARTRIDAYLINRSTAGALYFARSDLSSINTVYMHIGTDVGAGLVVDGRIFAGSHGQAGEFGHVQVDPAGPVCRCGTRGCLETYLASDYLARRLNDMGISCVSNKAYEIVKAGIQNKDPMILRIYSDLVRYLKFGIDSVIRVVDPQLICIGGEISVLGEALQDDLAADMCRDLVHHRQLSDIKVIPFPQRLPGHGAGIYALEQALELILKQAIG